MNDVAKGSTLLATPPPGLFTAILWKGLRDNLKWAVLGLVVVSGGLAIQLYDVQWRAFSGNDYSGGELDSLFTGTTLCAALVGLLFGLAQSLPENRGDRWGFLAHRPVELSTLYW